MLNRGPIVGEKKAEAVSKGLAIQDIQVNTPRRITKSGVWFVEIVQRDLQIPRDIRTVIRYQNLAYPIAVKPLPPYYTEDPSTVNLLFFSDQGSDAHLLFDREVFIKFAEIPHDSADSQDYALYLVVRDDSNGDGRMNSEDNAGLWLSDLYGHNLKQITPDSLVVQSLSKSEDRKQIYMVVRIKPKDRKEPREHWDQAIYMYGVEQKHLKPMLVDQTVLQKARSLLQR
ncbi:MAG: hypothetical protein EXS64_10115 [Candidatus Latescibacteria bacterium]|nr:hypothetical protein [Candidatus Latescibacterota bacterium]